MSKEIETHLGEAKEKIDELRSAINNVISGPYAQSRLNSLEDLMKAVGELVTYDIDDIYDAMDDAVNEIYRLDQENEELREQIGRLEQRITELLPEEEGK